MDSESTAVVGGGPIGLAVAWRLASCGIPLTVIDPKPGSGASFAAAGMLAPVSEAHYGEEQNLRLALCSAGMYPAFVEELESRTGIDVSYRPTGTLTVALDASDAAQVKDLLSYHRKLELAASEIDPTQARSLEPMLAPGIACAVHVPGDHQIDPRRLTLALHEACRQAGVHFLPQEARVVRVAGDRVKEVVLQDGSDVAFDTVIVAAGCRSRELVADIPGVAIPVRPVKGQVVVLRPPEGGWLTRPLLSHNLRCVVEGRSVYLVPRPDGRIIVGATVEEKGFDTSVTVEAVYDLLRSARLVLPAVAEMEIVEVVARLRPGSPDNAPMIGGCGPEGLFAATGHFRNGILLTPVTAQLLVQIITGDAEVTSMRSFSPTRFGSTPPRLR